MQATCLKEMETHDRKFIFTNMLIVEIKSIRGSSHDFKISIYLGKKIDVSEIWVENDHEIHCHIKERVIGIFDHPNDSPESLWIQENMKEVTK